MPETKDLRPTPDRVRETLFNWLQPVIEGARCLDLYAGSGALGLEAISRGAASVVLVEQNSKFVDQLQINIDLLGTSDAILEKADSVQWLQHVGRKFDIVFLDPPFGMDLLEKSCGLLLEHDYLYPKAMVYIEVERGLPVPAVYEIYRQDSAGQVQFMLIQSKQ